MPKTEQARKQPMGFAPLIEYVRVRTPSGIPSADENGQARLDPNGAVVWSQRGELLDVRGWKQAGLMLEQTMVLATSEADWNSAPQCLHGRRWADEALASWCSCLTPAKRTTL